MASRQATTALIRTADFRNNTISFPVESVLGIGQGTGSLLIEAPVGYVLTTPTNTNPQPRQSIPYVLQPNGTHVAQAVVTLLATELPLKQGTVTIQNPIGETTVLHIDTETETRLWADKPVLTLSAEALTFPRTKPGEEEYALLKVGQQGADTLVTLTSDEPAYFLMAIGVEELRFTATISFVPSPGGTFVHIRYAPDQAGQHTARLFVETSFETKTVALRGRAAGLLPTLPQRRPKPNRATQPVDDVPLMGPGRGWRVIALILAGGLAGLGYVYRCQLAPGLCREPAATTPVTQPNERIAPRLTPVAPPEKPLTATRKQPDTRTESTEPDVVMKGDTKRNKEMNQPGEANEAKSQTDEEISPKVSNNRISRTELSLPIEKKAVRPETRPAATPGKTEATRTEPVAKKRKAPAPSVTPNPAEESDLEKALNKKSGNP